MIVPAMVQAKSAVEPNGKPICYLEVYDAGGDKVAIVFSTAKDCALADQMMYHLMGIADRLCDMHYDCKRCD